MNSSPPSTPASRATRAHFAEPTSVVIRFVDGRQVAGQLKVVSLTGGLLSVPHPIDTGCNARMMFLTGAGMVRGSAQLLSPLSWRLQPFRFVAIDQDDQDKLKTAIQVSINQTRNDQAQVQRFRAW